MAERTYAMIKPDAMANGSKAGILERIKGAGFTVVAEKELSLSKVWSWWTGRYLKFKLHRVY